MVSYEDYVGMSAAAAVMGEAAMLAHYRLAPPHWAQIAGHWGAIIPSSPQYAQYAAHVHAETARLRAGGAPRALALGPPPGPQAPMPPPQAQGYPYPQPHYPQQANDFGNEVGKAFNAFGSALGSFVDGAIAGVSVGARVFVRWTDGSRYPGTVTAVQGAQVEVAFQNGQRHWVPSHAVSLT